MVNRKLSLGAKNGKNFKQMENQRKELMFPGIQFFLSFLKYFSCHFYLVSFLSPHSFCSNYAGLDNSNSFLSQDPMPPGGSVTWLIPIKFLFQSQLLTEAFPNHSNKVAISSHFVILFLPCLLLTILLIIVITWLPRFIKYTQQFRYRFKFPPKGREAGTLVSSLPYLPIFVESMNESSVLVFKEFFVLFVFVWFLPFYLTEFCNMLR